MEEFLIARYIKLQAFFKHDGNPKRPHVQLSSGGHSDGFFNWGVLAEDGYEANWAVTELARKLQFRGMPNFNELGYVIGPGYGAITLADRLAEKFGPLAGSCKSGFTEKGPEGSMELKRGNVKGKLVLACEDTITSGASVSKTIAAIQAKGGEIFPAIAAICNRSGLSNIDGRPIVALINVPMNNWTETECPLCKKGSVALRPKDQNNWELLNAVY